MHITLSQEELTKALVAYIKANAAVDVYSIKYARKGGEIVADIHADVQPPNYPVHEGSMTPEYVPADVVEHVQQPEELIDETFEVTTEEGNVEPETETTEPESDSVEQQLELPVTEDTMTLTPEEAEKFIESLEEVKEPNAKFIEAVRHHAANIDEAFAEEPLALEEEEFTNIADKPPWISPIGEADPAIALMDEEEEEGEPVVPQVTTTPSITDLLGSP